MNEYTGRRMNQDSTGTRRGYEEVRMTHEYDEIV